MPQSLTEIQKMRNVLAAVAVGVVAALALTWLFIDGSLQGTYILGLGALVAGVGGWVYGIRSVAARQQAEDALSTAIAQASEMAEHEAAQNQQLQRQIVQLLDEVSSVAEGLPLKTKLVRK